MKNFKILLIGLITLIIGTTTVFVSAYVIDYKNNSNVVQEKVLKDEFLNTEIKEISQNYVSNSFYLKFTNSVLESDKQYKINLKFNDDEKTIEEEYDPKTLARTSKNFSWNENASSISARNLKLPDKITKFSYKILVTDITKIANEIPVKPIVLKESEWQTINICEYPSKNIEYTSPVKDKFNEKKVLNETINTLDEADKKTQLETQNKIDSKRNDEKALSESIQKLKENPNLIDVEKVQLKGLLEKQKQLKLEINDLSNLLGEKRSEKRGKLC